MNGPCLRAALLVALCAPLLADGELVTLLVGKDDAAGRRAAEREGARWFGRLSQAFDAAAEAINEGKGVTVVIEIAAGEYAGKLGSGSYWIPELQDPAATLSIEGGYAADFSSRDPFATPTRLVPDAERGNVVLLGLTRKSVLGVLIVDGIAIDGAPCNSYLPDGNMVHDLAQDPFLSFTYSKIGELRIQSSTFVNSAWRVVDIDVHAPSPECRITFFNTVFLNCRVPLYLRTALGPHKPALIEVDHCSFLSSWPADLDTNTWELGALKLASKDYAERVVITNNLFHGNVGGAIQATERSLPALEVSGNDFFGNGLLHREPGADAVAMIVSVGIDKRPISLELVAEAPGVAASAGNVSLDPDLPGLAVPASLSGLPGLAPAWEYDPARLPFPRNADAARYGASPDLVGR